jgi:D-inositol-3-phosphate glycosyltransferase
MRKKIAFISEHASPLACLGGVDTGGQNVYVAELAKHLAKKNYSIDIFTRWEDPDQPKIVYWHPDIRVIHVKAGPVKVFPKEQLLPHIPEFRENVLSFIRQEEMTYSLIHANFFMSALVASDLKLLLNIPFVVTFHALGHIRKLFQGKQDKFPEERLQIEELTVRLADLIIAECPQDQADLITYYNANPNKIAIIPCGFSSEEFHPIDKALARSKVGLDPEEKILLQLGRMVPRKGVDNVIKSLSKLKNTGTRARLVIVGGESEDPAINCPEIERLKTIAREEGVTDQILFTGRKNRDVLKYYYNAADLFITTPWYEPFGITPLESMACGTPVIGSNVGGIKYSILDGETGFLVPPNNPYALAHKVHELLNNPQLLQKMKENSIHRVNSQFTWAQVANQVGLVYERILHTRKQAPVVSSLQTKSKSEAA